MNPMGLNHVRADIQSYIDKGLMFGANLMVAQGGEIALRESFGTVDGKRVAQLDDVYMLMSLSKSYTAVLTLKAIEQGWFTLNTQIAKIFPDFAQNGKAGVTVFHLLSHQAGLSGSLIPDGVSPLDVGNMDLIFNKIIADKPMFEAGTQASYSPYFGYLVLGKLLETADPKQRKFAQIVQDELFAPLNMQSSSFGNAMDNPKRVLASHTEKMKQADSTLQNAQAVENLVNSMANHGWQVPAGNAFGTIDDVFAFAENLRLNLRGQGVRILSPAMMQYATLNHCGDKDNLVFAPACQALGIEPLKANFGLHGGYVRGRGHQLNMCGFLASERSFGGLGGGTSYYLIDPERELTAVFLSAGFIEGLTHLFRVAKMNDLIIGAC